MNRERMPDAYMSGALCEALISLCGSFGRVSAGSACTAGSSTWSDELWRLCPAHFLLHAAAHFMKHLTADGLASIKDMVDMILLLNKCGSGMDWPGFWRTADRWGVAREVATVMATLSRYWGFEIPAIAADTVPIPARILVRGRQGRAHYAAAMMPRRYVQHLLRARELPGLFPWLRCLCRLLFPLPGNLRYRYVLPDGAALTPRYLLHPLIIVGRFVRVLAVMIWMRSSRS